MVEVTNTARQVRKFILNSFVNTGHAPNVGDLMAAVGLTRAAVLETFREIDAMDTFWIEKGTENIRLLAPFANTSTPYKVTVEGVQKWYAVCGLDALGIWAFFPGKTVQVDAYCRDCGEAIQLQLKDGQITAQSPAHLLVHLGVPVAHWMDDLPLA
jgi:Alkylmercury lyase